MTAGWNTKISVSPPHSSALLLLTSLSSKPPDFHTFLCSVNSDILALHRNSTLSLLHSLPLLAAVCHCNYLRALSLLFQHLCCLLSTVEVSFDKNTMEHVLPDLPHSWLWHQAFSHLFLFFLPSLGLIISNIIIPLLYEENFFLLLVYFVQFFKCFLPPHSIMYLPEQAMVF